MIRDYQALQKTWFATVAHTLLNNRITIGFPSDYNEAMRQDIKDKYGIHSDQAGPFTNIMEKVLSIFEDISSNSHGVSNICEVDILKRSGLIRKYQYSGYIYDLLKIEIITL